MDILTLNISIRRKQRRPPTALTRKNLKSSLLAILSLINRPKCHAIKLQDLIAKAVLAGGASLKFYVPKNGTVEEILTLRTSAFVRWTEILNEGCFGVLCLSPVTRITVCFEAKRRNLLELLFLLIMKSAISWSAV